MTSNRQNCGGMRLYHGATHISSREPPPGTQIFFLATEDLHHSTDGVAFIHDYSRCRLTWCTECWDKACCLGAAPRPPFLAGLCWSSARGGTKGRPPVWGPLRKHVSLGRRPLERTMDKDDAESVQNGGGESLYIIADSEKKLKSKSVLFQIHFLSCF